MLAPLSGIEPAKLKKLKFSFTPKNSGIRGEVIPLSFLENKNAKIPLLLDTTTERFLLQVGS